MVIRYKKTTQRQKHFIMAIVLSTAVIIILVGGVSTSFFLSSYVIEKSLDNPDVLLHLNIGNHPLTYTKRTFFIQSLNKI